MSADLLREAAALMRAENPIDTGSLACHCDDDGEAFTDHWFDRSICPEPCGFMHDICVECGRVKGGCVVAELGRTEGNRRTATWLAVADWLDMCAWMVQNYGPNAESPWVKPHATLTAYAEGKTGTAALMLLAAAADLAVREVERATRTRR